VKRKMSPLGPGRGDTGVFKLFEPILSGPTTPLLSAFNETRKGALFMIATEPRTSSGSFVE